MQSRKIPCCRFRFDVDLTINGNSLTLSTNTQPHPETGLGLLYYESSKEASERAKKKPRGKYTNYSDSQRHAIGKYASEYSTANTLQRYKDEFPELSKSTVRRMQKKYEEEGITAETRAKFDIKSRVLWKTVAARAN